MYHQSEVINLQQNVLTINANLRFHLTTTIFGHGWLVLRILELGLLPKGCSTYYVLSLTWAMLFDIIIELILMGLFVNSYTGKQVPQTILINIPEITIIWNSTYNWHLNRIIRLISNWYSILICLAINNRFTTTLFFCRAGIQRKTHIGNNFTPFLFPNKSYIRSNEPFIF